jgi:hypothetical protein
MNEPIPCQSLVLIKNGKTSKPPIIRSEHDGKTLWLLSAFGKQKELKINSISYSCNAGEKSHKIVCGENEYIFTEIP